MTDGRTDGPRYGNVCHNSRPASMPLDNNNDKNNNKQESICGTVINYVAIRRPI